MKAFLSLLYKEVQLEMRKVSSFTGLGLYLFSCVFVSYLVFSLYSNRPAGFVWSSLFWITVLFTSFQAVGKSFLGERRSRDFYYYTLAGPGTIILSKILYHFLLCFLLSAAGFFLFTIFMGNPVVNTLVFFLTLLLAGYGFSASLTLLSSIAARANNSNVLTAILGFPAIIGILLLAVKLTKSCIDDLDASVMGGPLITMLAINITLTALSYILFPYIWRS